MCLLLHLLELIKLYELKLNYTLCAYKSSHKAHELTIDTMHARAHEHVQMFASLINMVLAEISFYA